MSQQNEAELHTLDGERGLPSVNNNQMSTAKRGGIVLFVIVVIALGSAAVFWKLQQKEDQQVVAQKEMVLTSAVPQRTFSAPPPLPEQTPAPAAEVPVPPPEAAQAEPNVGEAPPLPGQAGAAGAGAVAPKLDKSASSLMVGGNSGSGSGSQQSGSAMPDVASLADTISKAANSGSGMLSGSPSGKSGGLGAMLSSTSTAAKTASLIGNRNFLLAKGAFIDCALKTRIDSTVPGMVACGVTRNIYSDNGKVLLIERGSEVTGEYQSNVQQGQARLFVIWSRIKTPQGVVIELDSPGTDQLGGAGVPGHVNTHFWKRFGGAIMLSLIDDVARHATQQQATNNNINFSNSTDATQDMAAQALKNTINIPPTIYKNQGEQVGIYVARDLNFGSVYDVTAAE